MLGACRRVATVAVLRRTTAARVGMPLSSSSFLGLSWFSSTPTPPKVELPTGSPDEVKAAIAAHDVVVFSKTWCGFCTQVITLFTRELKVPITTYELDIMPNGDEIQSSLQAITGQRSVPNVFVGGQHVGGCDDTFAEFRNGLLQERLDKL